jgi:hypothetical protein
MDHFNICFEGKGENMRVIVSGDATLFPRMLVFLESLGFERLEREENRYFNMIDTVLNDVMYVAFHSKSFYACGIPYKYLTNINAVLCRFRSNMMATRADLLFAHMRATSSFLHSKSDKELMESMKRYLVDESETAGADGGSGPAVGVRSSFGSPGTTSFSPKKPKGPDTRPAILARRGWVITIDKKRRIVTISGKSF